MARTTPSLAELAEWPLIIYPATVGSNFTDIVLGLFRRSGLAINVIQQVNELQTALGLVASELGFTLVPEQVRRIQRDEIAYVSLAEDNITSPILCCRRKEPAVGHHAAGQRDPERTGGEPSHRSLSVIDSQWRSLAANDRPYLSAGDIALST